MANRHFGRLADVWKHLVLVEALAAERPRRYAETHAGSGAYPLVHDPERQFGILRFLEVAPRFDALGESRYRALVSRYVDRKPWMYPGSAVLAMTLLGNHTSYLLCDLDSQSAQDLGAWVLKLGATNCEVKESDGIAAVTSWLEDHLSSGVPDESLVHIDPFDPHAQEENGYSALGLAARVIEQGERLLYWYGYDKPEEQAWAYHRLTEASERQSWCGDLMVVDTNGGGGRPGNLGLATTPGTGCGVVLANIDPRTVKRCARLGHALARSYAGSMLPDGTDGGISFTSHGISGKERGMQGSIGPLG